MPKARTTGLVVQELPGEVLVYDTNSNKAHCLNESAAAIWRACDGSNSISDIVREFEANTGNKVSDDYVWVAIDQLNGKGLLTEGTPVKFEGRSRRDVLKTIGLASVVALPIIASLAAPKNALAAASCNCSGNGDCPGSPGTCPTNMCDNAGTMATFRCVA